MYVDFLYEGCLIIDQGQVIGRLKSPIFFKPNFQTATKNLNFAAYPIITRQRFKRQSGDDDLENYDYENPPQNDYNTVVRIAIIGKCMTILF